MKNLLIFILLPWLNACDSSFVNRSSVEITYIANEGYLVRSGSKTVLIDALFKGENIDFCDVPSSSVLQKMEQAQDPFQAVDLVLVTHVHDDHFSESSVAEHLRNNAQCMLVCPKQGVERLKEKCSYFEEIRSRIREVSLALHASKEFQLSGIRVEAHRMKHCPYWVKDEQTGERRDSNAKTENLMFVVEMGKRSFLHVGDSVLELNKEYIQSLNLDEQHITAAFLEFFDSSEASIKIIDENIMPEHIIFMHLPSDKSRVKKISAALKQKFSNAIVFEKPMEKMTIR